MIIGGAGGMAWTGSGGSIPGWRETYLQGLSISDSDITSAALVKYACSVRIKNDSDEWVNIPAVTSFSVSYDDAGSGQASLTIGGLEYSSIGSTYPGLLAPDDRELQILATITSGGASATIVLFSGYVSGYSEAIGRGGSSISLSCKPFLERLMEADWILVEAESKTTFLTAYEQLTGFGIGGPILIFFEDIELTRGFYYSTLKKLLKIVFGWTAKLSPVSGGVIIQDRTFVSPFAAATITDASAISETRSVSTAAFNTVRIASNSTGTMLYDEISDATDVAKRGKIYAPNRLYSNIYSLAELETQAQAAINEQLLGKITIQTRLNPALNIGDKIDFTGSAMNLTGVGAITAINHSFYNNYMSSTITARIEAAT